MVGSCFNNEGLSASDMIEMERGRDEWPHKVLTVTAGNARLQGQLRSMMPASFGSRAGLAFMLALW